MRIFQVEHQQVADLVSFSDNDRADRLSMYMSRAVNLSWNLTTDHVLVSTEGQDLWTILADTVGENYSGGGFCNRTVNFRRYGRRDVPTCEDNFLRHLGPFGINRRDLDADTCFNIFMRVEYRADGSWIIADPICREGDEIILRAECDQTVGLSNCPQVLNAANAYSLKPLGVEVGPATG